jgi:TatD DNase family protein
MLGLPDCHAHLDRFGDEVPKLLEEWEALGIAPVVSAGMDLESSQEAVDLAWRLRNIKAGVGLHPWKVGEVYTDDSDLEPFGDVASDPMVVVVSEVGLDTVSVDTPLDVQGKVLRWFIGLAQDRGFPVILHQKAPTDSLLEIWDGVEGRKPAAAIHGFGGTKEDADAYLERSLYLSLGPVSLGLIGDESVDHDVIRSIPDSRLLVDSDAFPAFEQWPEVRPAIVAEVATRVAEIRGVSLEDLRAQLGRTFTQLMNNQW